MGVFSHLIDPPLPASRFGPVRGVSLEVYAQIARSVPGHDADGGRAIALARAHGISPEDWLAASRWWTARAADSPAVAERLGRLHRGPGAA